MRGDGTLHGPARALHDTRVTQRIRCPRGTKFEGVKVGDDGEEVQWRRYDETGRLVHEDEYEAGKRVYY